MNRKALLLALPFLTLLLPALPAQGTKSRPTPACLIKVAEPRDGQQAGQSVTVRGTATLPAGGHLWVFARREDFGDQDVWWPQAEGRIDSKTGEWRVSATIGMLRDIGWSFDIAVAVFEESNNLELKSYVREAMKTGNWMPIEMPESICPPRLLKVKKTSHN
jgi:hypothetical protein